MAMSNHKNKRNEIKICTINICGLSEKSRFVLDKYVDDNKFNAVAVQETGNHNIDSISLSNMQVITDPNNASNKGSALYIKETHTITNLPELSTKYKNVDSCWGLVVINGTRYIMGNVYVKLNAITGISDVISMLNKAHQLNSKLKSKGVILIGDMNARHPSWGDSTMNAYGKKLFQDLDNTKFSIKTADEPSFLCTNGSSYIDLIIVSNNITSSINKIVTDPDIELFSGAPFRGHIPLIVSIQTSFNESPPPIEKLSLKGVNWNEWASDIDKAIEEANKSQIETEDPQLLLEFIEKILNDTTGKHGKKITLCSHSKPYWNTKLSELSKQLRIDRRNFSNRNTDRNREKFLLSKEKFDQERKKACQEFIMDKTRNLNAVESQKFWKEFKKITTRKINQKVNPLEDGEGGILTETDEIEQLLFSTFFECRHMNEVPFDEEFYQKTNIEYNNIMQQENTDSEVIEEANLINLNIGEEEIRKNIKAIKSNGKSFDNHDCHPEMIKNLGPGDINVLLTIFNLCFKMSFGIWATEAVIFLKKPGKKSLETYLITKRYYMDCFKTNFRSVSFFLIRGQGILI